MIPKLRIILFGFLLSASYESQAYHLPLWETGVGLGFVSAPYYRGAKSGRNYFLPIPYVVYRGKRLSADREGARAKLFDAEFVKLNMSVAGNVPVPSDPEGARRGMPGLDPIIEFGPSLNTRLWKTGEKREFWLKLPLRAAFSVGNPLMDYQGFVFSPYFQYIKRYHFGRKMWRLNLSFGPIFASQRYNNYFYEVEPQYATPNRQTYQSNGGYSGSRITGSVARNSKHFYVGAFARYDTLQGAVFADSPLVETDEYFVFGLIFAWIFSTSKEHAPH